MPRIEELIVETEVMKCSDNEDTFSTPRQTPRIASSRERKEDANPESSESSENTVKLEEPRTNDTNKIGVSEDSKKKRTSVIEVSTNSPLSTSIIICEDLSTPTRQASDFQHNLLKSERRYKQALQEVVFEQGKNQDMGRELDLKNARIEQLSEEIRLKEVMAQEHKSRENELLDKITKLKHDLVESDASKRALAAQLRGSKEQTANLHLKINELEKQLLHYKCQIDVVQSEEKQHQEALRQFEGIIAKRDTELAVRRSMDLGSNNFGRFLEEQLTSKLTTIFNFHPHPCQQVDLIKFGSLTTTNEYLEKQVAELKQREEELTKLLDSSQETARQAKEDLGKLQEQMMNMEGSSERTHQYLLAENEKTKREKAEIRCELLATRREVANLQAKIKNLELLSEAGAKNQVLEEKPGSLAAERDALKRKEEMAEKRIATLQEQIDELKRQQIESEEQSNSIVGLRTECESLRRSMKTEEQKNNILVKGLAELNDQIEIVLKQRQQLEARWSSAKKDIAALNSELREKEQQTESVKRIEAENAALTTENSRLVQKISFLQDELRETHFDYREELARLARQCSEKNEAASSTSAQELQSKIRELEKQQGQAESQLKCCNRQIDELKQEIRRLLDQITDKNQRESQTNEENMRLRRGLTEAIEKAEKYKTELVRNSEITSGSQHEIELMQAKLNQLETEVRDMDEVIKEKDRVISYLQGHTNAQKMPRVKSKSTLLHHASDSSIEQMDVEANEVLELENMRIRLREQINQKRQELSVRKGSTDDEHENENVESASEIPYTSPSKDAKFRAPLSQVNSAPNIGNAAEKPNLTKSVTMGKMRHDIPHKWRQQTGFALRQMKCSMCFEGIPRIGHAMRCVECEVVVHRRCANRVTNTCGFPVQYATYYHDEQNKIQYKESTSTQPASMNGRVRVYCCENPHWRSAFLLLEQGRLSLFNDEGLAENLEKAFMIVDLHNEQWTVRMMTEGPNGEKDDFTNCIMIRYRDQSLYILCPTDSSTKRWFSAFQSTLRKRHFMTRTPSQFSSSTLLLALDTPKNLSINATTIFDDWLLIGAQEGLFATSIADPRNPFMVACSGAICALLYMKDVDIVACISRKNRQLGLLAGTELRIQLASRQPTLRQQDIPGIEYAHMIEYHEEGQQQYLLAADTQAIHVLQYKRDFFVTHMSISTKEPVTCLLSAHGGIYFGADSFYHVNSLYTGKPQVRALTDEHVADYPLAVMETGEDEVLLAYQNYGIFVNSRGEKERNKIVEWELTPMEFAYAAPYLYVVHCDSLEIMQVYDNDGLDSNTISSERDIYDAKQAHIVGRGPNGEVFLSLSNNERIEIHSFCPLNKRGSSKKRALANAFSTLDKKGRF